MAYEFPVFDLGEFENANGADRAKTAALLDQTCRETGFLAVQGHGVPDATIDGIWRAVQAFFAQSAEAKQRVRAPFDGYPYGYIGPGKEALAASRGQKTPPDLKESFNSGPLRKPAGETDPQALAFCYADTIWPQDAPEFRTAWQAYYLEMEQLAARIMVAFAAALGLPDRFFDRYIDAPISALRALNYPAQSRPPEAGQLRAGAHSDYGSLTILLPQANSRGLEILMPDGQWREIPPQPDCFVINIGDLMARWTNDRWVSTVHRVVNDGATAARQSLAFFHQPNWSAEITNLIDGQAPKYPAVLSGPYLMGKFQSTGT